MKEFLASSPLKFLEESMGKGLGKGNLGVLISRPGLGKTACLIHIALHKVFSREKMVHVSLKESPEKVNSYYRVIHSDLVNALLIRETEESRLLLDTNRIVLSYLNESFDTGRLRSSLVNLSKCLGFKPDALVVDGIDFEKTERTLFEGLKDLAEEIEVEMWLSAVSRRHLAELNDKGIPYPCQGIEDLFTVIMHLDATSTGVFLRLWKDREILGHSEVSLKLDPNTFLTMPQGNTP